MSEKTEQPTEQRKRQARKEGQVATTPDLGNWGGLLVASFLLPLAVSSLFDRLRQLMDQVKQTIDSESDDQLVELLGSAALAGAVAIAPLSLGIMLFSVLASAAQTGLRPAAKLIKPTASRINPIAGAKRMFGGHALWEGTKALLKTGVLAVVLYSSVQGLVLVLLTGGSIPFRTLIREVTDASLNLIRTAAIAGIVLAAADYGVARRRIGKQTRMTKQEVKEEHRRSEGDPQLKGAIRGKQMAMSRQRMMAEVPKSDVIVVNPSHLAVALRYDPARGAPRLVAKGAGALAEKIRQSATEHRIPMVQDPPLAGALYRDCDLGQEIPPQFYEAVARVLAFVMMLKAKGSAAGLHTGPPGR
jgi:flagellar biosynthetic protein FlhB